MSLDITLKINKPIKKQTTGCYVRENGLTKELKTMDEVADCFPSIDISNIEEYEYETDVVHWGNITHNMGQMASHILIKNCDAVTLYELVWRGEEHNIMTAKDMSKVLIDNDVISKMIEDEERLKVFNPKNGWGDYDTFLSFIKELFMACVSYPSATIEYSR